MADKWIPDVDIDEDDLEDAKFIAPKFDTESPYRVKEEFTPPSTKDLKHKFTRDEMILALRETFDKYSDPKLSNEFILNDAMNYIPVGDLIEKAPDFGDVFHYELQNLDMTIRNGIPEVLTSIGQALPDALVIDEINSGPLEGWGLKGWEEWSAQGLQDFKDFKEEPLLNMQLGKDSLRIMLV